MTIVVIGKSGQLASELNYISSQEKQDLLFLGGADIDVFDYEHVFSILSKINPIAIINASAYTAVDKAESDSENANLLNHVGVENIANFCALNSIHFTHVSTDYVFAGDKGSPYLPSDKTQPQCEYGRSKLNGEKAVNRIYPENSTIIRTSWVYSNFGNNFVKTMLRLMQEKTELGVIDDQIGSPTWARGLAKACLLASNKNLTGTHHYTDMGVASWYDFAEAIQTIALELSLLTKKIPIKPIPSSAYPTPVTRPHYSVMDKQSFIETTGLQPKHWRTNLRAMLEQYAQLELNK